MQIVTIILYGLLYAVIISIPVYLIYLVLRGLRSNVEAATTRKEIKTLLEQVLAAQKETNELLSGKKEN